MPSFRYIDSKRDQEIKEFLEKQKDKSECIRNALYQYIYPEQNKIVKTYIATIQDLKAQVKIMQQTILYLSKQTSTASVQQDNSLNKKDNNSPDDIQVIEEDIDSSEDFQIDENEEMDQKNNEELFSAKMGKLFGD